MNDNTENLGDQFIYDMESASMRHLTPHEGDVQYSPQMFSKDNNSFYYLTDQDSEFQYLVRHDLASDEVETVLKVDWDIWYAYLSKHGKYMVVGINNDGRTDGRNGSGVGRDSERRL